MIKALRAHDESLVDEAEFRRKIKVVSGDDTTGDGQDRGDGDTLPLDFPALPIDAISEAVYAAIPKKLGDREYWSEWAKSIASGRAPASSKGVKILEADQGSMFGAD